MKKLPRDEYGYVNGRGRSKYWGVTVTGNDEWMLSYHPVDFDGTHSASPNDFRMNEREIANIAAKIYENGQSRKFTESKLKVLSLDKKYVFWIRGNTIFRERYRSQSVTPDAPSQTDIFSTLKPTAENAEVKASKKVTDKKIEELAQGENAYVANLAMKILEGNLSKKSADALIALLEAIV